MYVGRGKARHGGRATADGGRKAENAKRTRKTRQGRTEENPWQKQLQTEALFFTKTSYVSLFIRCSFSCDIRQTLLNGLTSAWPSEQENLVLVALTKS